MKFQPEKEGKIVYLMRMFEQQFSLKQYIERQFIPALLGQEGVEFCVSILFGSNHFICDLYNAIWNKYAQEEPFELSDFQVFKACTEKHCVLYVIVPGIPGTEDTYTSGFAFAYDPSEMDSKSISMYYVRKSRFDEDQYDFEVFAPDGQVGCTRPISEAEIDIAPTEVIDLLWRMAFEGSRNSNMEDITDYGTQFGWEGGDILQQQLIRE